MEKLKLSAAIEQAARAMGCSRRVAKKRLEAAFFSGKISFEAMNEDGRWVQIKYVDGVLTEEPLPQ